MLAIHSDDEVALNNTLENYNFILNASDSEVEDILNGSNKTSENRPTVDDADFQGDIEAEPLLVIEVVRQNIKSGNDYFSLSLESKSDNKAYIPSVFPVSFQTSSTTLIGAVHLGHGYEFMLRYQYKNNWWNFWQTVDVGGVNAWILGQSSPYPYYHDHNFGSNGGYRRQMTLNPDERQNYVNYKVYFSTMSSTAYSQECPLGSYNINVFGECYYGTVPPGSNAFTYNYGGSTGVWFMYTTSDGTCSWTPEPGSGYDGANCKVVQIPPSRVGTEYIWQRNLNIKSYKIGEI
ncbi:MAG: hypothetical protein WEA99_02195 [Brumimicrobium sp.]